MVPSHPKKGPVFFRRIILRICIFDTESHKRRMNISGSFNPRRVVKREIWLEARARHQELLHPWCIARQKRASLGIPHPVYDFLFDYYSYRPAHLLRWSPGADIAIDITGGDGADLDWKDELSPIVGEESESVAINSEGFPAHRRTYLEWAIKYLIATKNRPSVFSCFGLHEWAMLFKSKQTRHTNLPLRLPLWEINRV